jgi:hypothetical protein
MVTPLLQGNSQRQAITQMPLLQFTKGKILVLKNIWIPGDNQAKFTKAQQI